MHVEAKRYLTANEPGYYEAGSFGIRIENLLIVREKQTAHKFNGRAYYGFEQLTHVPISTTCLEPSLLTAAEVAWLDGYHARVWERVSPLMDPSSEGARWLREVTRPLAEQGLQGLPSPREAPRPLAPFAAAD